ncbi:hypothetical protein DPMN_012534 [Dreissena polymorpha]|uniref:G-protein coupled receptors family 1 profile domain-containing protein n=1 Tax=Dreissena polymorpha TaxID=45954 RepID=A0A9D4N2N2_DREPO|nr:hypothetical protein DPMN_012534 [Dreissena polymorpha]
MSDSDYYVKNIALMLNLRLERAILPVIIFLGIVALVGIFGNILILIIYGRRRDGGNFRFFVLMITTMDLTSCITIMPAEIYSLLNWYNSPYIWVCKVKMFFSVFSFWGSGLTLILLAIDRYRKICRPLRWQINISLAIKLCITAVIFSATAASWVAMNWGRHMYEHTINETLSVNVSICEKTELVYEGKGQRSIGLVFIVPYGILQLVLLCLNSITSIKLFRQRAKFKRQTNAHDVMSGVSADNQSESSNGYEQYTSLPDFAVQVPESSPKIVVRRNSPNNATAVQKTASSRASNEITLRSTADRTERFQIMKQKTIIMLVLTVIFAVTMFLHAVMISYNTVDVLNEKPVVDKVLFFFFLRLHFLNKIVNIFVYCIFDVRFRSDLVNVWKMIVRQ